jgi:hypothetical protein
LFKQFTIRSLNTEVVRFLFAQCTLLCDALFGLCNSCPPYAEDSDCILKVFVTRQENWHEKRRDTDVAQSSRVGLILQSEFTCCTNAFIEAAP